MQPFTQKYALAYLLGPLPDGYQYSMEEWPLHVTLADVFAINGSPTELLSTLGRALQASDKVRSIVVGDEWLGEDKSVHVMLLDRTPKLQELHEMILRVLKAYGVRFNNPEFTGTGFLPHSTVGKDGRLETGDSVLFDSVSLIDLFPGDNPFERKILGTVSIGREQGCQ